MKQQILVISGGDTFENYDDFLNYLKNAKVDIERMKEIKEDWKPLLREKLGEQYEVFIPTMPNKYNAKYEEWKIWFEKIVPQLNDGLILIGHSLGASFLIKYLSENDIQKVIKALFLVGTPYDVDCFGVGLASFALPGKINIPTKNLFLYHSKDDFVVPFSALEKYKTIFPDANIRELDGRTHFIDENFPEIVDDIKSL